MASDLALSIKKLIFFIRKNRENFKKHNHLIVQRSKNGNCFDRIRGLKLPLKGFEKNCNVQDIVLNFFIARTETAGTIRMDPQFTRRVKFFFKLYKK